VSVFIHSGVLQEKVYEEITRIFEDSDQQPTKEDLEQMKYLDRFIKESLRLYPSVPALGRLIETDVQIGELRNAVFVSKRFSLVERSGKAKAL
jgi:cytochrome P450